MSGCRKSIRAGLGQIDAAVTADKLSTVLEPLLGEASSLNADHVFNLARRLRDRLDEAGIAAREKRAYFPRTTDQIAADGQIVNVGRDERLFTEASDGREWVRGGR